MCFAKWIDDGSDVQKTRAGSLVLFGITENMGAETKHLRFPFFAPCLKANFTALGVPVQPPVMGNQQSGDSADAIPEPSGAEAGPVLLGRERLDIEEDAKVDAPSSSFDVASLNKQQLVGPYLFGVAAPFFFVAAISALLPVPQHWQFSFTSLMLGGWSFCSVSFAGPSSR